MCSVCALHSMHFAARPLHCILSLMPAIPEGGCPCHAPCPVALSGPCRTTFDRQTDAGFSGHIHSEHNMFHYVYLMAYLACKV